MVEFRPLHEDPVRLLAEPRPCLLRHAAHRSRRRRLHARAHRVADDALRPVRAVLVVEPVEQFPVVAGAVAAEGEPRHAFRKLGEALPDARERIHDAGDVAVAKPGRHDDSGLGPPRGRRLVSPGALAGNSGVGLAALDDGAVRVEGGRDGRAFRMTGGRGTRTGAKDVPQRAEPVGKVGNARLQPELRGLVARGGHQLPVVELLEKAADAADARDLVAEDLVQRRIAAHHVHVLHAVDARQQPGGDRLDRPPRRAPRIYLAEEPEVGIAGAGQAHAAEQPAGNGRAAQRGDRAFQRLGGYLVGNLGLQGRRWSHADNHINWGLI
jgi:hypothetical protein